MGNNRSEDNFHLGRLTKNGRLQQSGIVIFDRNEDENKHGYTFLGDGTKLVSTKIHGDIYFPKASLLDEVNNEEKNRGYIEIVPEIITNNKINPNAGIEISKTLLRGSSTIDLSDNQLDVNLDGVINRIENKHFSDDYRRRLEMTKTNSMLILLK